MLLIDNKHINSFIKYTKRKMKIQKNKALNTKFTASARKYIVFRRENY